VAKDRSQNLSELLSAYLDGELDEATAAKVVAHLERDANAGLLLRELRETRSMLQGLPRESAPADFAESVVAAVERQALLGDAGDESSAGSARRRFGPIRSAAAIILLVGAAGSWIYWQIDRVQIAQMPAERSSASSGSLVDGHRPPDDFADSLAAAAVTADEAASTPSRRGMGDDSSESELAFDQLSPAPSSSAEELAIKAPVGGSFAASLAKKPESIGQFDRESEGEDQVVMLETEWSAEGAGDAGFGPAEFGLLRRLRVAPASLPIVANFIQQLEQGQSSEILAGFQFDGESNSLVLDFDNYQQREQFARGVDALLVSNSFLNVADPVARSQVADPEIQNVYLPGNAGINHTESDTTQILLRASVEVLEELLDEYTETMKYPIVTESVELKMGDILVAGVEDTRRTMKAMAVPQLRQKMLLDDQPKAEPSRSSAETPMVGRTVDEWKLYYDRIGENTGALFGEQLAQTGQPLAPDFEKEAGAEESLQILPANRGEQVVAGDAAEYTETAKKKRRVRPRSGSLAPMPGSVDGQDETHITLGLTSGPINKVDVGLVVGDRKPGRRGGKGKTSGSRRRAGNLTFILKMRVPSPVYEFEGPPAPPDLESQPPKHDEPSRSK